MKKVLKWLGIGAAGLVGLLVLAAAGVYGVSAKNIAHEYDVALADVPIPTDSAALARGRHVARAIAKCGDCHGADLSGTTFLDDPMLGRIIAPNITPAGVVRDYDDADWVRTLRHGVKPDGRSAVVMPSYEFYHMSDEDLGAVIAYMKQVAPVVNDTLPERKWGPMGRVIVATGAFPVLAATAIDHDAPRPQAPVEAATPEYGRYLANIGCVGCHGATLHGGKPPAPPAPDISVASGATKTWTREQFRVALRAGLRPDGTVMSTEMPWNRTTEMSDTEIDAIWAYLNTLPAAPTGKEAR